MDVASRQGVYEEDDARNRQCCTKDVQFDGKTRPLAFPIFGSRGRTGEVVAQEEGKGRDFEGTFDD